MAESRILVVEDDEVSRLCLIALLRQLDMNPEEAGSGKQALELLQAHTFDLVFMDLQLPDLTGKEVLIKLSSMPDVHRQLPPVIAVTTQLDEDQARDLSKAGFVDYLLKPVGRDTMKAIVDLWLGVTGEIEELTGKISGHLGHPSGLAAHLLDKFLSDLEQQLLQIEKAMFEGNRDGAATIVHQLNGGAGFVGLVKLQRLADKMETSLKEPRQEDRDVTWHQLKKEARRLMAMGPLLRNRLAQEASLNFSNRV